MSTNMAVATTIEIPENILSKMSEQLQNGVLKGEEYSRISFFLLNMGQEAKSYTRVLEGALCNDHAFNSTIQQLSEDTMKLKTDPDYIRVMSSVWNDFLKPNMLSEGVAGQMVDFNKILSNSNRLNSVTTYSFLTTLSRLPPNEQLMAIEATASIANALSPSLTAMVTRSAESAVSFAGKTSGKLVSVGLVAVYLAYVAIVNIKRWMNGEISGARCAKNVIDSCVGVACGVGGRTIGALIGTAIAPGLGTVVGGVIGGVAATELGNFLSDWATQKIFGLPKQEALENAYLFLGLKCNASNSEINSSFKRLALQYHPDKGGDVKDWHRLQMSMGVIKVSKGEF